MPQGPSPYHHAYKVLGTVHGPWESAQEMVTIILIDIYYKESKKEHWQNQQGKTQKPKSCTSRKTLNIQAVNGRGPT